MKAANVSAHHIRFIARACGLLAVFQLAQPLNAQPAAQKFTYSAQKVVARPNGVRLEGKAHIKSPDIDVAAQVIAFDIAGNQITQVRAQNKVSFKLNLASKTKDIPAGRIEATCDNATLNPIPRTLLLSGNVDGWYQTPGGPRNTLRGDTVSLKYAGTDLIAEISGGARGVSILIPAEKNNPAGIGAVTLTAERATVNSGNGTATFSGKARAVSTDGPNKFDVSAPEFVMTRGADDTIDKLQTSGRTQIKIDLPPEPGAAKPANGATSATPQMGRPTHLEAEADSVIVRRSTNTMDFQGNVKGFYELSAPGVTAGKYDFSGERVAVKYVTEAEANAANPAGLKVEMSGAPVEITAPGFDLNF